MHNFDWWILRLWLLFPLLSFNYKHVSTTPITICNKELTFEYDIEKCPGGIQLRNQNRWLSKSHGKLCLCGQGALLQFDGEDTPWHERIYPPDFPKQSIPFMGSWNSYNLQACESLHENGDSPSLLLISAKEYENPRNFPSRAIELIVTPTEHKRLAGSYAIEFKRGFDSKMRVRQEDLLKTILLNTEEPVLLQPDMENRPYDKYCAYEPDNPEIVIGRYINTNWNVTNIVQDCAESNIPPYVPPHRMCKASCLSNPKWNETAEDRSSPEKKVTSFLKFFELMGEVSMRLKNAEKRVPFTRENEPHVAILQLSSRLFFRAFPNVLKWETLLNAVTIFGIAFEGFIPNTMRGEKFDQIRLALGRCTLQQERDHEKNSALLNQICSAPTAESVAQKRKRQATEPPPPKKGSIASLSKSSDTKRDVNSDNSDTSKSTSPSFTLPLPDTKHNKLIDLLWKMVQYTQIKCLRDLEHHPNVLHFYVEAMLEVFTSPAVQLLWNHNTEKMNRAMLYIFPELPENTLQIIDAILEKTDYSTYFNILQRPKIQNLENRDMECAGHGKLIWGGRACCYHEEDDKKYRFYNRVAFAKV